MFHSFALPLLFALALSAAHAQEAPARRNAPAAEADFRKQMLLGEYEVEYQDHKGNTLTYEEFGRLSTGSFGMSKNPGTHKAIVKLADPDAPKVAPKVTFKAKAGDALPDFELTRADGSVASRKTLLGKPTLLNFMFADCAPCVKEVPELNALAASHPELNVAAVTFDSQERAKKFAEEHQFAWPMLVRGSQFLSTLGVKAYPSFALVSADGTILGVAGRGEIAAGDRGLDGWIARLLAPKS